MTLKVGFIGLGIMGKPMSKNLIKAGYSLVVADHNPQAVAEVIAAGAETAANAKAIAEQCDVIITMLPNSPHVKEVALGENGIIDGAKPGLVVIDMSSIAPLASREISEALNAKGVDMLDAPVSGGEPKAIDGTLSVMVGGDKAVFGAFRGLSCGVDSTGAGTPYAACIMRAVQTCAGIRRKGAFLRRFRMRGAVRRRDAAFADGFTFGAGRARDGCCCRFSACRGARVCGAAFHGGEHRDSTDLRRAVACGGKCRLGFEQRGAHPGFACVFGVFRGFCRDIV